MTKKPKDNKTDVPDQARQRRSFGLRAHGSFSYHLRQPPQDATRNSPRVDSLYEALSGWLDPQAISDFFQLYNIDQDAPLSYYTARENLSGAPDDVRDKPNRETISQEEKTRRRAFVKRYIDALDDESLSAVFAAVQSALANGYAERGGAGIHPKIDKVAREIASEVTTYWSDRLRPEHSGNTWGANPSSFIRHVYRRWLDAGILERRHLKHDPSLYDAYSQHVRRHPEDDLGLRTEQRVKIDDPAKAVARRRQQAAEAQRRYTAKKD
jgi:hypothetical protein